MLDSGARMLLLGLAYVVASRLGVVFALSGGNASTVWSPAGVAVGGLILWGPRLWPAVAVGAIVGGIASGWSPAAVVILAAGATVEALVAVELLRRAGFRGRFDRLRDVVVFTVAGCALPAAVGASSSLAALAVAHSISVDGPVVAWLVSWAGDAIRILLVGGFMLAWLSPSALPLAGRRSEALVGLFGVVALSAFLFFDVLDLRASGQSVAFPIIPVLIWVAFRVGPKGATLATGMVSFIALVATERGLGPFVGTTGEGSLMYVAVFLGLVAVTGDAVAAVVAEREAGRIALVDAGQQAERALGQLQAIEAIGRALAENGPTPEALDSVMGSLVDVFGYPNPSIYTGDRNAVRLGAQRGYDAPILDFDDTRGVIGRVMRTGDGVFLRDVSRDPGYVRVEPRIVSEIALPLRAHGEFLGVLNVESDALLDERDISCVTVVADRVAAALALARERTDLAARAEIFTSLATFTRRVTGVLAQDELYREAVEAIHGVLPADLIMLTVLDAATHEYVVRAEKGSPGAVGSVIRPGEGAAGIAIRDRSVTTLAAYGRPDFPEALRTTNLAPEYADRRRRPAARRGGRHRRADDRADRSRTPIHRARARGARAPRPCRHARREQRVPPRRGLRAGRSRCADGPPQPSLLRLGIRAAACRPEAASRARAAPVVGDHVRPRPLRELQQVPWPPGG